MELPDKDRAVAWLVGTVRSDQWYEWPLPGELARAFVEVGDYQPHPRVVDGIPYDNYDVRLAHIVVIWPGDRVTEPYTDDPSDPPQPQTFRPGVPTNKQAHRVSAQEFFQLFGNQQPTAPPPGYV